MKNDPIMKSCILYTIKHPQEIAKILRDRTTKQVLNEPLSYALAVCPRCQMVKGKTEIVGEKVEHSCRHCNQKTTAPYKHFDYWFYHKPLAIPRLEICDIDICITGFDHYSEGDYLIRQDLIDVFNSKAKFPKTLYAPLLLDKNGDTIGKSRGNAEMVNVNDLIKLVKGNTENEKIQLPDELTTFSMSEKISEDPSPAFSIKPR